MRNLNTAAFIEAAIATIRQVQLDIADDIKSNPRAALTALRIDASGKPLLGVDFVAERNAESSLRSKLGLGPSDLAVLGEEQLSVRRDALDLTSLTSPVALLDMVDGTDLLERGLGNWCSAMTLFDPSADPGQRILAAFVGIPEDGVYYAAHTDRLVHKYSFHVESRQSRDVTLEQLRSDVILKDASICFYGQQALNLSALVENRLFIEHIVRTAKAHLSQKLPLNTRIYTLAGNPMMIRMLTGNRRIDAVFDLKGQAPHDVVPGAYIALKAGAILRDVDGGPIDLEKSLLHPSDPKHHLRYILAANLSLAEELQVLLGDVPSLAANSRSI